MTRLTTKRITAILNRLLYLISAAVLLVAFLTTLERGLPAALSSGPASSQVANYHYTDSAAWTTYRVSDGLASDFVLSLALDGDNMWFGTSRGVSVFDGNNWTTYGTSDGLVHKYVTAIAIDQDGNKWFGTSNWVSMLDDGGTPHNKGDDRWITYDSSNSGLPFKYISAIAVDQAGNKWFGTWLNDGYGYGVSKFDGESWMTYSTSNGALASDSVNAITVDPSGNVWVGTSTGGVSKFNGVNWTIYRKSNSGLASNHVMSIAIEGTNVKWFGGCTDGYNEWCVEFICVAAAASRFDGGWATYGPAGKKTRSIAIDWGGNKWFGSNDEGISKFDGATWTNYNTSNVPELGSNVINAIAIDNAGNIWFGTYGGGVTKYGFEAPPLTSTPTATPTDTPTPTSTPTPTATTTATPTPTGTPGPTATPTPTGIPTSTPTNTPTATPSGTPTATPIVTDTPTVTATPTATTTPTATVTPTATDTPEPQEILAFLPCITKHGLPCGWNDPDDNEPGNDFWKDPAVPYGSGLFPDRTFWSPTKPVGQKGNDPDWFQWKVDRPGTQWHWLWTQSLDPDSLHIWLLVYQAIGDPPSSLVPIAWGEAYELGALKVELEQGQRYFVSVGNLTPSQVGCYGLYLEP